MTDDHIIDRLRAARGASAIAVAELLAEIAPGGLDQATFTTYFKRAFPEIPLRTLLDAGGWHRLTAVGLTDAEFEALLRPWFAGR